LVPEHQAKATKAVQCTSNGARLAASIVSQSLVGRIALTIRAKPAKQGLGDVVVVGGDMASDAVRLGQELEPGALLTVQRPARAGAEHGCMVVFGHD
jgi:hypothetical protein